MVSVWLSHSSCEMFESFTNLYMCRCNLGDRIKKDVISETSSTYGRDEKNVHNFSRKT
jgi:hypothetical protein